MAQKKKTAAGSTRWVGRYRDHQGKEHSKSFDTQREAKAWEAEQQRAMRRGEWLSPEQEKTTLSDLAREWLKEAEKPNTVANRDALCQNLGPLAGIPIRALTAGDIAQWRATLLQGRPWKGGKPLSSSTVAVMTGQVSGLLSRAQQDGLIARVPRISAPKAPPKAAVSRQNLLTPGEIQALVELARQGTKGVRGPGMPAKPWLARMIWVGAGAGLRLSEVAGLHPEDVDQLHRELMVERQVLPGGRETGPLKNSRPRRVPLPDFLIEVLHEQIREAGAGPQSPVFPGAQNPYHDRNSVGRAMRQLSAKAELGREVRFHDLRHYYASVLIASGAPVTMVQAALGHANPSITLETYSHLWPQSGDVVRDHAARGLDLVRDFCGIEGGLRAV